MTDYSFFPKKNYNFTFMFHNINFLIKKKKKKKKHISKRINKSNFVIGYYEWEFFRWIFSFSFLFKLSLVIGQCLWVYNKRDRCHRSRTVVPYEKTGQTSDAKISCMLLLLHHQNPCMCHCPIRICHESKIIRYYSGPPSTACIYYVRYYEILSINNYLYDFQRDNKMSLPPDDHPPEPHPHSMLVENINYLVIFSCSNLNFLLSKWFLYLSPTTPPPKRSIDLFSRKITIC
jgi:hypothetical protein